MPTPMPFRTCLLIVGAIGLIGPDFTVTPLGMRAIRATHRALANLTRGLETILGQ